MRESLLMNAIQSLLLREKVLRDVEGNTFEAN